MSTRKPARPNLAEAKKLIAQMRRRAAVTQPRYIDLRPDCLLAPNAIDVAVVSAWMLWPNDEAQRRDANATLAIEIALKNGNYPPPTTPAEHRVLYDLIRSAPRVGDYGDQIKHGFWRGMFAGQLLLDVIGWDSAYPGQVTLGPIKARLARKFSGGPKRHVAPRTIDNKIWHDFRCVAPFWAAQIAIAHTTGAQLFPVTPPMLGTLLAAADDFRRRGETVRTRQSPTGALLRAGETVMIPPEIELPRGRLRFVLPRH